MKRICYYSVLISCALTSIHVYLATNRLVTQLLPDKGMDLKRTNFYGKANYLSYLLKPLYFR